MPKHVMIVDDDANNVDFLSTVLKKHGYQWSSAKDGKEGLEALKSTRPDLLVLDVMMPKKTGFAMFKNLKGDESTKDIPVIMLTAIAGVIEEDKQKSSHETVGEIGGAFHDKMEKMVEDFRKEADVRPESFLDKPIQPDSFITEVKKLIGEP